MPSERLQVILELTAGQYKREAREAATATGQIGNAAQGVTGRVTGLGGAIGKLGGVMAGVFAGAQIGQFAKDTIMAASDLEESINAVNVVFGDAAEKIHEFGETSVDSVGLAAVNVNTSATVLGSALINAGLDADTAAEKVIDLTTRASDMASVFNTTVPDALGAIQSALRGETDPIEKFGVTLTAAAVDAEAAALGYEKVAGQFDATAKTAARLSLIMKATDIVAGDFQNTGDSTANTLKKMNERFTEMKARIGTALMPAFKALLDIAEDSAPIFEDAALAVADLVSELTPLFEGIGHVLSEYRKMKDMGEDWSDSMNPLIAGMGEFISHIGPMAVLTGNYTDAAVAAADVTEQRLNPSFKEAGEKAGDAGRGMEFMADAAKDDLIPALEASRGPLENIRSAQRKAADAAQAHRDALIQLTSRLQAQLNPALAAYQAIQDLEEAEKEAGEAALEFGADSEEAAEAQLNLAVQTAAAQAALNAFGDTKGAVRALADTLNIAEDAAAQVLIKLGLISEGDWRATVIIGVRTEGDLSALERGVIPEGQGIRVTGPTTVSGPFHSGGIVPGSIGSDQLIWAQAGEMVVPANQVNSWGTSSFTGGDVMAMSSDFRGGDMMAFSSQLSAPSRTVNMHFQATGFTQTDMQYGAIVGSVVSLVENI